MHDQFPEQLERFALAIAIGLLMGLERERKPSARAGLRTFALTAAFGCLMALLTERLASPWPLAAGLAACAALMIAAYHMQPPPDDPGTTSVIALLLCFALGATTWFGYQQLAVSLAIISTVLLYFKTELSGIAARLSARDLISILQFAVLSLVVLPVLPDRGLGPYQALNPHQIWVMVVLVSGISLAGYAALRLARDAYGPLWVGLLGGLVSSTATTLVYARQAGLPGGSPPVAVASSSRIILIANLVMITRVGALSIVLAPPLWQRVLAAIVPGLAAGALATWWLGRRIVQTYSAALPDLRNPTEIPTALGFGAIYALVLLAAAWLYDVIGTSGLYTLAVVSGMTDVDAISLSVLRLFGLGSLTAETAVSAILLAVAANLTFKFVLAAVVGKMPLARAIWPGFAAVAAGMLAGSRFLELN